jgi:hypothetical protein
MSLQVHGRPLSFVAPRPRATGIGAIVKAARQVCAGVAAWAKGPSIAYAEMWHAGLVARLASEPEYYAPDPYSLEFPFLKDSWPLL